MTKNTFTTRFLIQASAILLLALFSGSIAAQKVSYENSWGKQGFSIKDQRSDALTVNYSIQEFTMTELDIKGEDMTGISLPGHFLPNDAGAPDLPGSAEYIAIPEGATVKMNIINSRTETFRNINLVPAFVIPKDSENEPLEYKKDQKIYSRNAFYPANPVQLSQQTEIRGVDVALLGVTPFQYNPVTKELIVYRDLEVEITFEGGSGQYGEERLRSRFWDPILKDALLNNKALSGIDYTKKTGASRDQGYEYVIVVPDDPDFIYWADSLKAWRIKQGITTTVVTIDEIGGNNTNTIETWVNDIFASWDPVPSAILLVGDYGTSGNTIVSPIWDGYCVSDHIYADVNNNDMADIVFARMTARDAGELETMFSKIFSYETNPPTNPDFYDNPITALGWQTERWFQICSESVGGYFKHVHGKDPVRINAIYSGNPNSDPWSTNQNTHLVMDYFGPNGQGYIPATPGELGGWTGGNATMVNNAINSGAFILQHRDHGYEQGWGEPDYSTSDLAGLDNDDLVFVFSINCLTGKYNIGGECFAEAFHRHDKGALGIIAASEVSYSFVNDTYVWGMYDNMWPNFMPDFESTPEPRGIYPAFGNVAGKYFLQQSNWPYNTGNKEVTYHLFHNHGGAFNELYSEVPQYLTVLHDDIVLAGLDYFTVTANEGSMIALTVGEEIIGLGEGTGQPLDIPITPQYPPTMITVTITLTNHYRYSDQVQVIPPTGPYVVKDNYTFTDENGNGQIDNGEEIIFTIDMKNVGSEDATDVDVTISSEDDFVNITDDNEPYGDIPSQGTVSVPDGFSAVFTNDLPDNHNVLFSIVATDGSNTWNSSFAVTGHAPFLEYVEFTIDDSNGNNNGRVDPGETVDLIITVGNDGSAPAYEVTGELSSGDTYVTVNSGPLVYGEIAAQEIVQQIFSISADPMTPTGHAGEFTFDVTSASGHIAQGMFEIIIGQIPILILDLDGNSNSANWMETALDEIGITYATTTTFGQEALSLYNSIFVCLGIYSQNHVLTDGEGTLLAEFLDQGGKLYMEGGDTWAYNSPTPVHPYFKVNGLNDGSDDLGTINGQDGTLAEGMTYTYAGDNSWIDRLGALSGGQVFFENASPVYGCGVSYHGGTYKTIGTSFEFGGLIDGEFTKKELMEKYLEFFDFNLTLPEAPPTPTGLDEVCGGEENVEYTTETVANADYYIWVIEPADAGIVNGNTESIEINWNASYAGSAMVKVCGQNAAGAGPFSDGFEVNVKQAPTAVLSGDQSICQGDEAQLTVDLTGTAPWHLVLGDGSTADVNETPWLPLVTPDETMEYLLQSVSDASGCENIGEGSALVTVLENPVVGPMPDTSICCNHIITLTAPQGFAGYSWYDPATGQTYSGMEVTVDSSGVGIQGTKEMQLTVTDENGCEGVTGCLVIVNECAGIGDNLPGIGISVYPNPSKGIVNIDFVSEGSETVDLKVTNAFGKLVYSEDNIRLSQASKKMINLSDQNDGVYFLIFENENGVFNKKIIINK